MGGVRACISHDVKAHARVRSHRHQATFCDLDEIRIRAVARGDASISSNIAEAVKNLELLCCSTNLPFPRSLCSVYRMIGFAQQRIHICCVIREVRHTNAD